MIDAVLDTNILIDYLIGIEEAERALASFTAPAISIISWIEVLAGARDAQDERDLEGFLARFERMEIDGPLARRAARLRRTHRIKLPDAIVLATAEELGAPLVSRDEKAFAGTTNLLVVPYRL